MTRYNIAINGYGRIGRCVLRALYESKRFYEKFNITAINEIAISHGALLTCLSHSEIVYLFDK